MTNAQMAHKMGIDKAQAPGYAYKDMLVRAGMTLVNDNVNFCGMTECYEAKFWTQRGWLHIYCGQNGTARIDKPNGTHKWVYEKTPAQIASLLKQVIDFNK